MGHLQIGYSDSDHAGDIDDRRSISGVLLNLGTSPITWQSSKKKVVALSRSVVGSATEGSCEFRKFRAWSTTLEVERGQQVRR